METRPTYIPHSKYIHIFRNTWVQRKSSYWFSQIKYLFQLSFISKLESRNSFKFRRTKNYDERTWRNGVRLKKLLTCRWDTPVFIQGGCIWRRRNTVIGRGFVRKHSNQGILSACRLIGGRAFINLLILTLVGLLFVLL